ncbi:MAG: imidazole glycerol phosphate synthase subunit HisH [Candidatus Nezhaarchaeales archaeon]
MVVVAIIDYGIGNLRSIKRGLEIAGATPIITNKGEEIASSDAIVLPGVGSFKSAMQNLGAMLHPLQEAIRSGKPVLGICLGLQLYFERSEEGGGMSGLGLIEGYVDRLPATVKTPHIGWNTINIRAWSPIIDGISDGAYMYFVHSYKVKPRRQENVVATTTYGCEFPSIVEAKPLIFGTQFHPEKSSKNGLTLLKNFVNLAKR